jgi:hypothetical protein
MADCIELLPISSLVCDSYWEMFRCMNHLDTGSCLQTAGLLGDGVGYYTLRSRIH